MVANRHTCCICHEPRHPVEKHHIDEDPSNNAWGNLAVLCRNCHGLVTAKGSLGSRYTKGEVLAYKRAWEEHCREADEDEIESPLEEIHETKFIEGDDNEEYSFEMNEGDELVFSLDANDSLDVVICDDQDIEEWSEGEHDEDRPLPNCYWSRTGVMEGEYAFVAPEEGRYVLLIVNWDDEGTEVTVDAAVWEAEEE